MHRRITELCFFVLALGFALPAWASLPADVACYHDSNRDGVASATCSGTDADEDGETVADGDCDDHDPKVRMGLPTAKGCSAGEWHVCRADGGGYTSCVPNSTAYCPASGNNTQRPGSTTCDRCFYISQTTGDNTRSSTTAQTRSTPWHDQTKFSYLAGGGTPPAGGSYTPLPGDCFIFDDNAVFDTTFNCNYSNAGGSACWFATRNNSGTSAKPIQMYCHPGKTCRFQGSKNLIYIEGSGYWIGNGGDNGSGLSGEITLSSTAAFPAIYELSGAGGEVNGHNDFSDYYTHDIDGTGRSGGNDAAISFGNATSYNRGHHNVAFDNYDRGAGGDNQNEPQFAYWNGTGNRFDHNEVYLSAENLAGGIKKKHSNHDDNTEIDHNIIVNANATGHAKGLAFGTRSIHVHHNLLINSGKIDYSNQGGGSFIGGATIDHNTIIGGGGFLSLGTELLYNVDNSTAADTCSSNYTPEDIVLTDNIVSYTVSSFAAQNGVITISSFGPDSRYAKYISPTNVWKPDRNFYYNTGTSHSLFQADIFDVNDANVTCAGRGVNGSSQSNFTNYRALNVNYDPNSVIGTDPQFNGSYVAQAPGMEDAGWRPKNLDTPATTTTTTSATTTTTATTAVTTTTTSVAPGNGAGRRGQR